MIPTTRSQAKAAQTLRALETHLESAAEEVAQGKDGDVKSYAQRVTIRPELCDLCSLASVRKLARRLRGEDAGEQAGSKDRPANGLDKIDTIICNAGYGGWTGVYWSRAIYAVLTDLVHAVTWPTFKNAEVGTVAAAQIPASKTQSGVERKTPIQREKSGKNTQGGDEALGEIFTANVFGHYVLVHELMGLLYKGGEGTAKGRVIWLSTLEAYSWAFRPDADFQGLTHTLSYESSKRLTDIMILTSHLPSTAPWVNEYLANDSTKDAQTTMQKESRPKMYLAHPGVCGTSILPLPWLMTFAMIGAFYLARWLGSIWHTITPYSGATAPVWLALASEETLSNLEEPHPSQPRYDRATTKWGSATDAEGKERVERTEVEGWGWSGRVGESSARRLRGRMRGAVDLTQEGREEFEELGRTVWTEMERLRGLWKGRLDAAGL